MYIVSAILAKKCCVVLYCSLTMYNYESSYCELIVYSFDENIIKTRAYWLLVPQPTASVGSCFIDSLPSDLNTIINQPEISSPIQTAHTVFPNIV